MLNMKYCRTENVIDALREWINEPGSDEELHGTLARICLQVAVDAGLVPEPPAITNAVGHDG